MSSNNISGEEDGSFSSGNTTTVEQVHQENEEKQQLQNYPHGSNSEPSSHGACNNSNNNNQPQATKKKRNLPGTPDPNAEVIALSPRTLMARKRFVCEICKKGFQRDQNLQLHRRGHNLPWKLRQRAEAKKKRVYVCPEEACVHHNPARALGDLTGIKKHYSRKHCEKKWKCDKCSKTYAVQSDWKAHLKTCGTRDYKCDCGTIFSRRDSFITHRAFCDALTEENNRVNNQQGLTNGIPQNLQNEVPDLMTTMTTMPLSTSSISNPASDQIINNSNNNNNYDLNRNNPLRTLSQEIVPSMQFKSMNNIIGGGMFSTTTSSSSTLFGGPKTVPPSSSPSLQLSTNNSSGFNYFQQQDCKNNNLALISGSAHMSATALLQKAAQMGATASNNSINSPLMQKSFVTTMAGPDQVSSPRPPPPYNPSSYDHFHAQKHDQSHMPFTNQQFFHKGQQEMPMIFDANNNSSNNNGSTMNDQMGMFSTMFMGSNHSNTGLMKDNNNNVEQDAGTNAHGRDIAEGNNQMGSVPMFGGSDDMTTVHDFLGIGGSTPRGGGSGLHQSQKHHHQQQRMELDALSHQRLPFVNHFHQHRLQHGDSAMEKSVWGHLC